MEEKKVLAFIKSVIEHLPEDWLRLTTHRLDIYNESLAKIEFLDALEALYLSDSLSKDALVKLPTAYDYIRLGHPLSCVLEWTLAKLSGLRAEHIIAFSSKVTPVLAVLRKNHFDDNPTRIYCLGNSYKEFDAELIRSVYGYTFEISRIESLEELIGSQLGEDNASTVFVSDESSIVDSLNTLKSVGLDFLVSLKGKLGSLLTVLSKSAEASVSEIQHVRRRETIAMTPADSLTELKKLCGYDVEEEISSNSEGVKAEVKKLIKELTRTTVEPIVGSSGLSIQYAIMMGLLHDARVNYPNKNVRIVVPPNCYGGTNDQARRVAACFNHVTVVDLPVDGDNDMVNSVEQVLEQIALEDAVPYIIAEIPTNPRVEVPDLDKLNKALSKSKKTNEGTEAVEPVFILDQTFCPNVDFLGEDAFLSGIKTISYSSGSKFPSGGLCTAGYCVANNKAKDLMEKLSLHLSLCDNEATDLQYEILAEQMPTILKRINGAYENTRNFVEFIEEVLPDSKINFVSQELAKQGFTPSVFSLDLPTKGNTDEERESYKRKLNHKLINLMISEIPEESKYCVSYGQLKGCYWTIPATSTQGTTKEGDKDYIARVACSSNMDLEKHKQVFKSFVEGL